jgi:hypothetical protein
MIRIVFFCIIFFKSLFSFAFVYNSESGGIAYDNAEQFDYNWSHFDVNSLVGNYSDCFLILKNNVPFYFSRTVHYYLDQPLPSNTSCFFIGWVSSSYADITAPYYPSSRRKSITTYPYAPPPCPSIDYESYPIFKRIDSSNLSRLAACVADCADLQMDLEECSCPYVGTQISSAFYVCEMPPPAFLSLSQKTLIKTNDLISESNSKLGLISGGTAAQTGLLSDILNTFRSLLTKTAGLFGTGDFAGNSEEDNSFIDFVNRDSSLDVTQIQPLVSSSGSCPASVSVSFFGRSSEFSYQPTCDFATRIRPIVVNAARVAAAWILMGAAL